MTWFEWLSLLSGVGIPLGGIICFLLWNVINGTVEDMRKLESSFNLHQLDVANNYAKQREVNSSLESLKDSLAKVQEGVNTMNLTLATFMATINSKHSLKD